ncbi:MAG: repeat, subfamily [Betaproteobacteria bacterium]|nr:repeat, subfamily [Betaproteobacteria bacterium]
MHPTPITDLLTRSRAAPRRFAGAALRRLLLALLFGAACHAYAGAGIDAYNRGDWDRAWRALEGQAQGGDTFAQYYVGKMYQGGLGRPADASRALYWYSQAASKGHAEARVALASLRDSSTVAPASAAPSSGAPLRAVSSVPCDPNRLALLGVRSDEGDGESALELGLLQESSACGEPDYGMAARYYKKAAERNLPQAQNNLGALYYEGKGVEQDYAAAQRLYGQAAEAGHAVAQYNLALMIGQGRAGEPNPAGMIEWLNKSAAQDYPRAQAQLARFYLEGVGVEKDPIKAAQLFLAAAQQGLPNAQYFYGHLTSLGIGVKRDVGTAADWILKAADAGVPVAQQEAAGIFELGLGRPANRMRALALYRQAGSAGVKAAAQRLEQAYRLGELGVRADPVEAQRWAALAQ